MFNKLFEKYLTEASFKQFRAKASKHGVEKDELINAYNIWKQIKNQKIKEKLNFNNYLNEPELFVDVVFSYMENQHMKPMKERTDVLLESDRFVLVSPQNPKAAIRVARSYKEYGCDEQPLEYMPTWCISSSNASKFWDEYILKSKKFRMLFFVLVKHPSAPEKSRYAIAMDFSKMEDFLNGTTSFKNAALEIQDATQKMYDTEGVTNLSNLKEILHECRITLKELSSTIKNFIIQNIDVPKEYKSPNFTLFQRILRSGDSEKMESFAKRHVYSFDGFYFDDYPFLMTTLLLKNDMFESILKSGIDVNRPFRKTSPLWYTIQYKHDEKAKLLLKYGANPNVIIRGRTIVDNIISAVSSGNLSGEDVKRMWNALSEYGACSYLYSKKRKTLMPISKVSNLSEIFNSYKNVIEAFGVFGGNDEKAMIKLIESGDINVGAINNSSFKKDNLLTTVLKNPFLTKDEMARVVTTLVDYGINIDYKNAENETALSISILRGFYKISICLIVKGANPNIGNTLENFIISENKFEPKYLHTKVAYFLEAYGLDISTDPNIERYVTSKYKMNSPLWRDKSYGILLKKVKGITKNNNKVAPVLDEEEDEVVGVSMSPSERQMLFKALQRRRDASRELQRRW